MATNEEVGSTRKIMQQTYLGVDIGGETGTWVCLLKQSKKSLIMVEPPAKTNVAEAHSLLLNRIKPHPAT